MSSRPVADLIGRRDAVVLCLATAVACSAAIVLVLDSHLIFVGDDWELLLNRRGSGVGEFLDPFNGNIIFAPVVIYKLLLGTFGMGSALPFYVVSVSLFLLSPVLLFVYLRPRLGDWPALLAAILILFLGAAFEVLLWPIGVGYFGSVAAGIGMLLALDRDDERGDMAACALLAVSLAFSQIGLPFAVGALADLALSRRPRGRRAYVALLPMAFFGLWWLGWGHTGERQLSWDNVADMPEYVFNAVAAGITSLLGLATGDGTEPDQPRLIWGKVLLVAALALAAFRIARGARVSRDLAIVLAIGLAFWVGVALNQTPELGRFPTASRHQFPSAVFVLLIGGEALRGLRIPTPALLAGALVTGAAVFGGLSLMHDEYDERWKPSTEATRYSLAAVEIAGESADPSFVVSFPPSVNVSPQTYLSAVDEYGSPAYSESELAARPEADRAAADGTLAQALELGLAPTSSARSTVGCQTVQASASVFTDATLLRGGFTLTNRAEANAEVLLGRFSDGLSVDLGPLSPGSSASLVIPVDNSKRPWRLGLAGDGPVRLCTTAPE